MRELKPRLVRGGVPIVPAEIIRFVAAATAVVVVILTAAATVTSALAAVPESGNEWISLRTKNFTFVGNADERDVRQVAHSLEQFRAAFAHLFSEDYFDSSIPTRVVVFRDHNSYLPFKPPAVGQAEDIVGHFQPGPDVDYIMICVGGRRGRSLSSVAVHEYLHLLVRNGWRGAPLWFREGVAEYYSTALVADGARRITLGKSNRNRLLSLRRGFIPLRVLLTADAASVYYNERDRRDIFYAQSWALIHYLLNGGNGARAAQLSRYLGLVTGGVSIEDGFRQAFETDFAGLEKELREYIRRARYPEQVKLLGRQLSDLTAAVPSAALTRAEVQAQLGDALRHTDRFDEAENYLREAVALDPDLAAAHISLGALRLRQNRFDEAKEHLQRALAVDARNHLAHYYYADLLSREGPATDASVKGYRETTHAIRSELTKAIELAPEFVESYKLLAAMELERGGHLREAETLLTRAVARAPQRQDLLLLLARLRLGTGEAGRARRLLETILAKSSDPYTHAEVGKLLAAAVAKEAAAAAAPSSPPVTSERGEVPVEDTAVITTQPCDMPQPGPQRKRLRFDGRQACGQLIRIECEETGVVLVVDAGTHQLRLRSEDLSRIRFVTYTAEVRGQVSCGAHAPTTPVLVTYRPAAAGEMMFEGEAIAVEFVPSEWSN